MLFSQILSSFCLAALVSADAAPVNSDSPRGVVYQASFNGQAGVRGFVRFYSINGYARYYIDIRNLPTAGAPYDYKIHQRAVPASGDCRRTLGDFNPYDGEPNAPTLAEYEVGDLSGKHGVMRGTSYRRVFSEPYISLNPNNAAFVGDLSLVIHRRDGSRLTCTNLSRTSEVDGQQPSNLDTDEPQKNEVVEKDE